MLQQKFIVQVTTLPDCDDITRFDGMRQCFWRNCFDLRFKIDIVVMII